MCISFFKILNVFQKKDTHDDTRYFFPQKILKMETKSFKEFSEVFFFSFYIYIYINTVEKEKKLGMDTLPLQTWSYK